MTDTDLLKQAREALAGLDEAYCRAGSPLSKAERNKDRARLVAARSVVAAIDAQQAATGGSPEHLLQDHSRELSQWLASKPDARLRVREACADIAAQQAATVGAPTEFDHDIGANRFTVVKGAFWWHIRIGDGTANVGKFYSQLAAEDVALKMLTVFRDGAYMQHQRALSATPPAVQAAPISLLWQAFNALKLAGAICDAVPSRDPGHLGRLVNAQPDGSHGYHQINDAIEAMRAYLTEPEAAPPAVQSRRYIADLEDTLRQIADALGVPHGQPEALIAAAKATPPAVQAPAPLTDEWLSRHALPAATCPGGSMVVLLSSIKRHLGIGAAAQGGEHVVK